MLSRRAFDRTDDRQALFFNVSGSPGRPYLKGKPAEPCDP